jgi:hypothetical protein
MLRGIVLAAVMFLLPSTTRAGMITWQYSSTLTALDGTNQFVEGALDLSSIAVGNLVGGNSPTVVTGNQSLSLGEISSLLLAPNSVSANSSGFVATIQITDLSSGLSGTLSFSGYATAAYVYEYPTGPERTNYAITVSPQFLNPNGVLNLGNQQFDVHVSSDVASDLTTWPVSNVITANISTFTTPEPATLISAIMGAGVIVAGFGRRSIRIAKRNDDKLM